MRVRSLSVLLLLALASAPTLGAQMAPSVVPGVPRDITLLPGDALRVTVWRRPEFTAEMLVAPDGSLVHPLYREIVVTGLPMTAVEAKVRTLLQRYETSPMVVVEPLLRVLVTGEVRKPDLYSLPAGITVVRAITLANGVTDGGRADRVLLVREGTQTVIDLTREVDGGGMTELHSGDQLIVPRRVSVFREYIVPAIGLTGAVAAIVNLLHNW